VVVQQIHPLSNVYSLEQRENFPDKNIIPNLVDKFCLKAISRLRNFSISKMVPPTNRKEILAKLHAQIADGKIIVGAGAGIGLSAKFVEAGGGDLIIIYNSGRFRMAGRGSLAGLMPYGNANDIVLDMVRILLKQLAHY
jgi:hypothetical protein